MYESIEPHIRALVAEYLGVEGCELERDVSLVDDLAADSLDLVELALLVEEAFGIVVPERALDHVRTYGDLVDVTTVLARLRGAAAVDDSTTLVRARVIAPEDTGPPLERSLWLTPYAVETLTDDALRVGRGARLELTIGVDASDVDVARLREGFRRLATHGVTLTVRRDDAIRTERRHPSAA